MSLEVRFLANRVRFERYPFRPATVRKEKDVAAARVTGWASGMFPPTLYREGREVLFVPKAQQEEMAEWASRCGVSHLEPVDVWGWLLEPFLDTEDPPEAERTTMRYLAETGFPEEEVVRIRQRVERPMLLYNSVLWEWVHLGQYDLLHAMQSASLPWTFRRFYWESMEVAFRGVR